MSVNTFSTANNYKN